MSQNFTREQAITKHRQRWNWIADETIKRKRRIIKMDYFNENLDKNEEPPLAGCYACQYSAEQRGIISFSKNMCQFCPIDWHSDSPYAMCMNKDEHSFRSNTFAAWSETNNWKKAAELARQIAELPERKEE